MSVNAWWINAHRTGLPFDIDEAGYLQRGIRDTQALHASGLRGLWSALRLPDPQAPLLPVTSGIVRWITGAGPYGLLNVDQLFYVVTVVGAYWAGSLVHESQLELGHRGAWSQLLPGLVESSRGFSMAVATTAALTAALAVQAHTDRFTSWSLTPRVGRPPGCGGPVPHDRPGVPPRPRHCRSRHTRWLPGLGRRQLLHVAAGLSAGPADRRLLVHAPRGISCSATSPPMATGHEANQFGASRSVLSVDWWTFRLHRMVSTALFVPYDRSP